LDLDHVDGLVPKTITFKKFETVIYSCYVHQYSNDGILKETKARM